MKRPGSSALSQLQTPTREQQMAQLLLQGQCQQAAADPMDRFTDF